MATLSILALNGCESDSEDLLPDKENTIQSNLLKDANSSTTNKSSVISDGANGGIKGFYFLPPLVKAPSYSGTFDPGLSPLVEIFDSPTNGTLHASFSMSEGEGSEIVRVDEENEHYIVNWHTDQTGTEVGKTYRIRLSVAGTVLGHADIKMAENGQEAKNITDGEAIALIDGRTLPIKFRIEEGAVYVIGSDGGSFSTTDGLVDLVIPSNAVNDKIGITVNPVEDELNDPDVVPGALFDFGPSPYSFNQDIILTIKYDPANLPSGVSEDELRLLAVVNGEWVQLPGSSVDVVNHTVTGPLSSFSRKGVGRGKVNAIEVKPVDPSIAVGETLQFEAVVTNVDNEVMSRNVQWSSSDETIATIDNSGLATAVAFGETTIEAKSGKVSGNTLLKVAPQGPVVSRIEVAPATANIEVGSTQQFTATVYDQNDEVMADETITWSSSDTGIASVNETGLATGIAVGQGTINATAGSVMGSAILDVTAAASNAFITKWDTTKSNGTRISFQLRGEVNATIDWGDGTAIETVAGNETYGFSIYHTYATEGIYTVSIIGNVPHYTIIGGSNYAPDRAKLIEVASWGDVGFTSLAYAFGNCVNLVAVPSVSTGIEGVTDMSYMFAGASSFNGDIGAWDTSNVTNMRYMFIETNFNQNIGSWNTGNVTNMEFMFYKNQVFNQNIGGWNTSNVTNMQYMFSDAIAFNQDIGYWNTSKVTNMRYMFANASAFNQNIGGWDTGNVLDMISMFELAVSFNQDIGGWNTTNVERMVRMFKDARSFNRDLGNWNTSKVLYMNEMFWGASAFNGNLSSWDTSNVREMYYMFNNATAFNQDIGGWNTGNVRNMRYMFYDAKSFNQDLSKWCVTQITSEPIEFDTGAASWVLPRPVWGTCPTN